MTSINNFNHNVSFAAKHKPTKKAEHNKEHAKTDFKSQAISVAKNPIAQATVATVTVAGLSVLGYKTNKSFAGLVDTHLAPLVTQGKEKAQQAWNFVTEKAGSLFKKAETNTPK
ncbi:MAG: hypothetical protein WCK67_01865 [bacterium]